VVKRKNRVTDLKKQNVPNSSLHNSPGETQGRPLQIPEPSLAHLQRLTDKSGIFEHAAGIQPDYKHGYCAEDVSRALVAVLMYARHYTHPAMHRLADTYLKYLKHAQLEDGRFHHRTSAEGKLSQQIASGDDFGRVLWGLGCAVAYPLNAQMEALARQLFDRALLHINTSYIQTYSKATAYSVLGLHYYLKRYPKSTNAERALKGLADFMLYVYEENSSNDWCWFEDVVTYDNAKLPHCLLAAYETTGQQKYLDPARQSLDFLISINFPDGQMMQVIGNRGWYQKGKECPRFDQQPIDAAGMVQVCAAAYRIFNLEKYKDKMISAFQWFLGYNALGLSLYDDASGGSRDGLGPDGVNSNQGAESSIMYLIANLTVRETCGMMKQKDINQP
jgi:hypothetical protein